MLKPTQPAFLVMTAAFAQFLAVISASASDATIENHLDEMNKHYEVASKYFGDGSVQLHSRQEGADGTSHSVHHFDCANSTYEMFYTGGLPPEELPTGFGAPVVPLDRNSAVAPLAQHACTKHGHPLLEW